MIAGWTAYNSWYGFIKGFCESFILDNNCDIYDTDIPKFYIPFLVNAFGKDPSIFLATQQGYPDFNTAIVY